MKLFKCTNCGNTVYFENTSCGNCGFLIGFDAEQMTLLALKQEQNGQLTATVNNVATHYKYCANQMQNGCNWLMPENNESAFCKACDLNKVIPDLRNPEYVEAWQKIETAKRRLVYGLLRMKLPIVSKTKDEKGGLAFAFMADTGTDEKDKVFTGHDEGLITINVAEANDIDREMARQSMHEVYRTLLGHFRHEIGHYYWDRLIDNTPNIDKCRQLFGDDRQDYEEALQKHYAQGTPPNWNNNFISPYASTHPWEDWAETWAHYMHIVDTLETAYSFGLSVDPKIAHNDEKLSSKIKTDPYSLKDFETIIKLWLPLTFAMNSLNRSMGLQDIYPFVITNPVQEKLKFIHEVVLGNAGAKEHG
ncbi:putative zinc-binding metallopeptidase [Parasediminibacterium sp. JCM 36343]|uniref:zinc-binding metallopeptidase family protein n=1 Tax=Parasediminibacterium sp. JCM 36343 TaxID=3374279 RepID=UPI00397984D5